MSLYLEDQTVPVGRDFYFITRLELAFEQAHRKRIENVLLHGAFERARAELRVVTFPGQQFFRGGVNAKGLLQHTSGNRRQGHDFEGKFKFLFSCL